MILLKDIQTDRDDQGHNIIQPFGHVKRFPLADQQTSVTKMQINSNSSVIKYNFSHADLQVKHFKSKQNKHYICCINSSFLKDLAKPTVSVVTSTSMHPESKEASASLSIFVTPVGDL